MRKYTEIAVLKYARLSGAMEQLYILIAHCSAIWKHLAFL